MPIHKHDIHPTSPSLHTLPLSVLIFDVLQTIAPSERDKTLPIEETLQTIGNNVHLEGQ